MTGFLSYSQITFNCIELLLLIICLLKMFLVKFIKKKQICAKCLSYLFTIFSFLISSTLGLLIITCHIENSSVRFSKLCFYITGLVFLSVHLLKIPQFGTFESSTQALKIHKCEKSLRKITKTTAVTLACLQSASVGFISTYPITYDLMFTLSTLIMCIYLLVLVCLVKNKKVYLRWKTYTFVSLILYILYTVKSFNILNEIHLSILVLIAAIIKVMQLVVLASICLDKKDMEACFG